MGRPSRLDWAFPPKEEPRFNPPQVSNALTLSHRCATIAIATGVLSAKNHDNSLHHVTEKPVLRLGILHERQAGREERCAQGSLDSTLDQSPKSFGIS